MPRCLVALALTIAIIAAPAAAQMALDPTCKRDEASPQSCIHVIACIGGSDVFVGGSVGWDTGTLYGDLSTGATCTGNWNNAEARADFTCTDGQSGTVFYTLRDGPTGTAIGQGVTIAGRPIEAWSGENVSAYIRRETGEVTLTCGVTEIPMS